MSTGPDVYPLDVRQIPGTIGDNGEFDGGDSAAIWGTVEFLVPGKLDFCTFIHYPTMKLIRHPDKTKWYGQPDRFSRDQLIPILCAGKEPHIRWGYAAHKQNLFSWAWNTRGNGAINMPKKLPDITGPLIWSMWMRIYSPWWAVLVLELFDLELLIDALLWRFVHKGSICRNYMLSCLFANKSKASLVARLAYWLTDWDDLTRRWITNCRQSQEYQTGHLFRAYLGLDSLE